MSTVQSHLGVVPVIVARGGTGLATQTAHAVYVGNGTSPPTALAVGATGTVLAGATGADPAFTASPSGLTSVTSTSFVTSSATLGTTYTTNTIVPTGSDTNIDLSLAGKGTGGVIHSRSAAAVDVTIEATNSDNTSGSSRAGFEVAVGGASAGDPYVSFLVSGAGSFAEGIDNSSSDNFVRCVGTALGTNNFEVVNSSGVITYPLQPAFLGYLASTASDKTGNGTTYTLGTDALTELYDRGSNFTTAGVFTAPVTALYDLMAQVTITGATIATTFVLAIVVAGTSARSYSKTFIKAAGNQDESIFHSVIVPMTATDTATVTITVSGEGGDTDDILGAATLTQTFFCGALVA
jgi:hypothetical protein